MPWQTYEYIRTAVGELVTPLFPTGSTFADQVAPASFSKRDQDESMGGNDPWKIESIELLDEEDGGPLWDDVDWEDMKFEHAADSN
ncbi:hypothetical protein PENARI_c023G03735 [Penicillium arizonense]|uniref:Uncharacterized protein n=1 Tax=Penicillium arizonense TaxID=1835702 RepID=A0A1F5L7F6_PENAI|nr:hypothetical protein PENARI_c023G03735 [Penicillium arizonense]OGE49153.1 hypothetical protein PENARI_c023G03735 [Penicillium arizonense]